MTRRGLLPGLALVAALALPACSTSDTAKTAADAQPRPSTSTTSTATTTAAGDEPIVALLGDSNTYESIVELGAGLTAAGLASTINGISGSGLKDLERDWRPAAELIRAAPPEVVVVALGTNDALDPADVPPFDERLQELLDALGDVPVIWVTHTERGGLGRAPENQRAINDVIRAAPQLHPNVTVLDLAPLIAADRSLLGDDALHYSPEGRAWFADQITTAIQQRL